MDKIEKIRSGTLAIIEAGMARNTHPPMPAAVADAVAFIQTADDDVLEVNFHQFAGGPKKKPMHTNLDVQHSLEILQAAVALANGVGMRRGYDKAQFDGWNGDEAEAVLLGEKYGVELDPKRPMRTVRKIFNM